MFEPQTSIDVVDDVGDIVHTRLPMGVALQAALNLVPAHTWYANSSGVLTFVNERCADYLGLTNDHQLRLGIDINGAFDSHILLLHPDDREQTRRVWSNCIRSGSADQVSFRVRNADGTYRWFLSRAEPVRSSDGTLLYWIGVNLDIEDRKQAESEREREFQQILDLIPQHLGVFGPDGSPLYANRVALDYFGVDIDQWRAESRVDLVHPDDREHFLGARKTRFLGGVAHEFEARMLRHDGSYRWFLFRLNPLKDERGHVTRWYGTATDIEDRKQGEDRLQHENAALREEINETSMFEEIVGTAPALRAVLSNIAKVAPTDATVLITGETGTGKELVARAIHRRSGRSSRAFVSVNCAAIPRDLIASELFGHEKGAFTGATQRRLGRFELADGGTIFLDEVGELAPDTQVALLRALQEREFERVGGRQPIQVDVRVVAATNRDLKAAVGNGTFRQDLFYRLNVFPIEMPPLRQRKDDILMLVEYFVQRYGKRAGKNFRSIDKKTLEVLQGYDWPGNIRELQNIIERSVILSSSAVFSVDGAWLSKEIFRPTALPDSAVATEQHEIESRSEREIIETALSETRGRVAGPAGAAARLGIPPSTLDHRIKALKINKKQFKYLNKA
ncbi:MAG TPA: sigma 54-interacting transcriptional regulator [Pyrinomonadaceae bacterium]|nr:sigma 54-interacting transcriptional regulator [Pyrinomonadaceae bacterium]